MSTYNNIQFVLKDDLKVYRQLFINHFHISSYPINHIFNQYGLPVTNLYYLVEGSVNVYTINKDGYTRFIGTHKENTIFNLDSFYKNDNAVITTQTSSDVKVIALSLDDIIYWLIFCTVLLKVL